jgi:hypothetical protein
LAEQVALAHQDPGDPVLPRQHARPLQGLQSLIDGIAVALGLGRDRLIAWEADAGVSIVEAPQQGLQDLLEGPGDRTPVCWRGWRFRALQARA